MVRYLLTAGALGAGWFVVLLVPSVTREWLLADPAVNLACLVVASAVVAIPSRRFVRRADTFGRHLLRAAVIPYLGCIVYLTLRAALMWARTLFFGGLVNVHDTLSLYVMGLTAGLISFYVVIPYGLFCQYAMRAAAPARDGEGGANADSGGDAGPERRHRP